MSDSVYGSILYIVNFQASIASSFSYIIIKQNCQRITVLLSLKLISSIPCLLPVGENLLSLKW